MMLERRGLAALLSCLVAFGAEAVWAQVTTRVSVGNGGFQATGGDSLAPAMSADGRLVAFDSAATNLVAGDTNAVRDVFVHDRQTATTTRVSVGNGGFQATGVSLNPAISGDGRLVVFDSRAANLVAGDTNGFRDIFLHDRQTQTVVRVSVANGGVQATGGDSHSPSISADGRFVAFASLATNLVPGDTNGVGDVFLHDRQTATTTRVSVGNGGFQATGGASQAPALSSDGRFVAFDSLATNLVAGDTNGQRDVFVHDRQAVTTTRASVGGGGFQVTGASSAPALSSDGRLVAFVSNAANLVAGDTNGLSDVFVHDRQAVTTTRVSVGGGGFQGTGGSSTAPALTPDGRFVAFDSGASNLVAGDTNGQRDIFVHDRQRVTTRRASVGSGGFQANDRSAEAAISTDGRFVAFHSGATNLGKGDTNRFFDVFFNDRGTAGFSGSWDRVTFQCPPGQRPAACKLTGRLAVTNPGTAPAAASLVQFFLSTDEFLDLDDDLLAEVGVDSLEAGETEIEALRLVLNEEASGMFLIALLDATNEVDEANEENNEIVSEPLALHP